jgi:hypothetical protein
MMGFEPTAFCMANASDLRARSLPFAQLTRLQRFRSKRANASEPERTSNLAILATGLSPRGQRFIVPTQYLFT